MSELDNLLKYTDNHIGIIVNEESKLRQAFKNWKEKDRLVKKYRGSINEFFYIMKLPDRKEGLPAMERLKNNEEVQIALNKARECELQFLLEKQGKIHIKENERHQMESQIDNAKSNFVFPKRWYKIKIEASDGNISIIQAFAILEEELRILREYKEKVIVLNKD